jgi:hypothetical protein
LLKLKAAVEKTEANNKALKERIQKIIKDSQTPQGQMGQVDTSTSCEEQLEKYWKILTDYARSIQ